VTQEIEGTKHPWDDAAELRFALQRDIRVKHSD
jgi:hypothetical protein